jgi:membrane associated rhomboid family serine protease
MFPLKDSIRIPFTPAATYFLIAVNVVVFLYQYSLNSVNKHDADYFLVHHALIPCRYFNLACDYPHALSPSDYLPFIEGTFMHGGWLHLILNMWTLFIFGTSLEGRIGRFGFIIFYLLCAVIASFAHAYFNQDSAVATLGASGAIAGVLGGYSTTFPRAKITILILIVFFPLFFKIPALGYTLIWFALQLLPGFIDLVSPSMGGGIAWWAHIGGFAAGFILIPLFRLGPNRTYDEEKVRLTDGRGVQTVARQREEGRSGWTRGPWG